MCSTLNIDDTKKCTCHFSHLCKRRRKMETIEVNEQDRLNSPTAITISAALFMDNNGMVVNFRNAKEGDHI